MYSTFKFKENTILGDIWGKGVVGLPFFFGVCTAFMVHVICRAFYFCLFSVILVLFICYLGLCCCFRFFWVFGVFFLRQNLTM